MVDRGYEFWKRVDKIKGNLSLNDIANSAGINYRTMLNQRSQNRIPKKEQLIKISNAFGVSIGFLLGTEEIDNINITPEMEFVRDNEAARLLVRKMMENPSLLAALSAVAALSEKSNVETKHA